MYTETMFVKKLDGDKVILTHKGVVYETLRSQGDKDVLVGEKVIVAFNNNRLWYWLWWDGNVTPAGNNSVMLPNKFKGEIMGYRDGKCLIRVNKVFYWIPDFCRVPTGHYDIKVTCRYANTMSISRWKIDKSVNTLQ